MTKVLEFNYDMFNRIADAIEAEEESFDQRVDRVDSISSVDRVDSISTKPSCNTPCCVLGWAKCICIIDGKDVNMYNNSLDVVILDALGITHDDAVCIYGSKWNPVWFRAIGKFKVSKIQWRTPAAHEAVAILREMARQKKVRISVWQSWFWRLGRLGRWLKEIN